MGPVRWKERKVQGRLTERETSNIKRRNVGHSGGSPWDVSLETGWDTEGSREKDKRHIPGSTAEGDAQKEFFPGLTGKA